MFVSEFVKFATTLPPERVDGQPKSPKQDSFLVDAIRQHGIPITVTDYETGVEEEPLPKKAAGDGLGKYSEDQPRDEKGRFSSEGSAAENASTVKEHQAAADYHQRKAAEMRANGDSSSDVYRQHLTAAADHAIAANAQYHASLFAGSNSAMASNARINAQDKTDFAQESSAKAHAFERGE